MSQLDLEHILSPPHLPQQDLALSQLLVAQPFLSLQHFPSLPQQDFASLSQLDLEHFLSPPHLPQQDLASLLQDLASLLQDFSPLQHLPSSPQQDFSATALP